MSIQHICIIITLMMCFASCYNDGKSLEQQRAQQRADSLVLAEKSTALKKLFYENPDTLSLLVEAFIEEAKNKKQAWALASGYNLRGSVFYGKDSYRESMQWHRRAFKIQDSLADKRGMATSLHNIGLAWQSLGRLDKAADFYLQSLRIEEKIGDPERISLSYNNIGLIFHKLKDEDKALSYLQKGYDIATKATLYSCLLYLSANLNEVTLALGEYEAALAYTDSMLVFAEKLEPKQKGLREVAIAKAREGRATTLRKLGKHEQALEESLKAEAYFESKNLRTELMLNYIEKTQIYFDIKNNQQARQQAYKAMQLALQLEAQGRLPLIYERLAQAEFALGNTKEAYQYLNKRLIVGDSIQTSEQEKNLQELETRYETSKKVQQIRLLSQQTKIQQLAIQQKNTLLIALSILLSMIALGGFIFYRQRQLKAQYKLLLAEQKWLRSQMNPHFFFNALTAIQAFVMQSDKLQAAGYIARFARLMRQVLENSREEFISLSDEIETLDNYLALQQIRFPNKFAYEINTENLAQEELDSMRVPSMLAQPLVENAIEHGIKPLKEKGTIKILFQKQADKLILLISDNGIGRKNALENKSQQRQKHVSRATQILNDRIKILNQNHKISIVFAIKDLESEKQQGTQVRFELSII
ncbi:MAG: histidine kinase [Bernardetiaceae bacterium]|nr:histidine kinase [Bernardetiaceae bacterium]